MNRASKSRGGLHHTIKINYIMMKKWKTRFLSTIVLLAMLLGDINICKAFTASKNTFFAGTSKIMITPGTPIPMRGYGGRTATFKGVHDDLFVRVIVFSDGINKAVLISADVIGFSNSFWEETTQRITKETGIKKEYVLLSAVHNHGGPVTKVYDQDSSSQVNAYVEELKNKIIIATKDAIKNMVPVCIGAGKGMCKMIINRRAPDGKGGIELGQNPYVGL